MSAEFKEYRPGPSRRNHFWAAAGMPAGAGELHRALHKGFSYSVYDKLAALSGLDKKELARAAVIKPATLRRRARAGKFNQDESDRLYRFARLLKAATDLFEGDKEEARAWLTEPVYGLDGRRPVDMLATSAETEFMLDLIGRLEHGVCA